MTPDEELLEQLKAYRPPKKLHPIAGKTYDLYDAAGFKFTDEALDEIRKDLHQYDGDLKALTDALCGLAAFIMYAMENLDDKKAAEQIAEVMKEVRPQYEPLGERLGQILQDISKKATGILDRFSDRDQKSKTRAPVYDEEPPQGTVPLKQLKPVAQPPPVRKKK